MDRRVKTLIGALVLFGIIVAAVLIGQGMEEEEPEPIVAERQDKPEVEIPDGRPPEELVVEDLEDGEGAEAEPGDLLEVDYVGVLFDGGDEFDESFSQPEPFQFTLGQGEVIPGWDQGLEGMKAGGRRQLVIPSDLAYGPQGSPPDIPPDSALVFVIDLISIN